MKGLTQEEILESHASQLNNASVMRLLDLIDYHAVQAWQNPYMETIRVYSIYLKRLKLRLHGVMNKSAKITTDKMIMDFEDSYMANLKDSHAVGEVDLCEMARQLDKINAELIRALDAMSFFWRKGVVLKKGSEAGNSPGGLLG